MAKGKPSKEKISDHQTLRELREAPTDLAQTFHESQGLRDFHAFQMLLITNEPKILILIGAMSNV